MRKDSRRAIATDSQGHEIRINDNMKEAEGEGRKGTVLHIHQSFYAFLHNREIVENGGVFVTRARGLVSVAPKGRVGGTDLSKLNPAMSGGMVGSGMLTKGPRDKLIGVQVWVAVGQYKGYQGTIKETNGPSARVELQTQNKVITIEKGKLRRKGQDGKLGPLDGPVGFNFGDRGGGGHGRGNMGPPSTPAHRTPNPYQNGGGMTPGRRLEGRTPNPYADGGRTPGFGGDGGRTPGSNAWAVSSRTPNPYAASGRTPNPYTNDGGRTPFGAGSFGGGRTPGRPTGGATPNPYANRSDPRVRPGTTPAGAGASSNGWGGAADGWGGAADDWGAPTPGPANAPTPGVFAANDEWGATAETPGAYAGAPTPYASAPTPGVHATQTPGVYAQTPHFAPTPGVAATPGMSAPTPGPGSAWGEPIHSRPAHWLVGAKNVIVRVEVAEDGTMYQSGDLDDSTALVLGVTDMSRGQEGFNSTADCKMLDGPKAGTRYSIPLQYLGAVRPTSGDDAWVIHPGPLKGKVVQVFRSTDEVAFVTEDEDTLGGGAARDTAIPIEGLVKVQKWVS